MTSLALHLNNDFVQTSVQLGNAMRDLRNSREALRQQLARLSVRKMELQLTRRSLVVVNAQIAEAQAAKDKVVLEIDALLKTHNNHLRRHTSR